MTSILIDLQTGNKIKKNVIGGTLTTFNVSHIIVVQHYISCLYFLLTLGLLSI